MVVVTAPTSRTTPQMCRNSATSYMSCLSGWFVDAASSRSAGGRPRGGVAAGEGEQPFPGAVIAWRDRRSEPLATRPRTEPGLRRLQGRLGEFPGYLVGQVQRRGQVPPVHE